MPKHPIKDPYTGEWYFNDRWYDHFPHQEIDDYNALADEATERKWEERKGQ